MNLIFKGKTYSIDDSLLAGAISGLEAHLSELQSGGGESIVAGLYETGSNYTVMKKSWQELLDEDVVHVENGAVYTNVDISTGTNSSASALAGDLMLPNDGSITKLGDFDTNTGTGNFAFSLCTQLTGIQIPNSVTSIGAMAFIYCISLTNVTLPDTIIAIEESAFNSSALTNMIIPDGVTSIGSGAFQDCGSLRSVVIGASVTTIGKRAFDSCASLESITFKGSAKRVGDDGAFAHCPSLIRIIFEGTTEQWKACLLGQFWNADTGDYTVYCIDGTVAKDGTVTYN